MTAEQLSAAGVALYGPHWHSALARALGVSEGLVRFWLNGERGMLPGLLIKIDELLAAKIEELRAARGLLKRQHHYLKRRTGD